MTLEEKNEKLLVELGDAVLDMQISNRTRDKIQSLLSGHTCSLCSVGEALESLKDYAKSAHDIDLPNIFICLEDDGQWSYFVMLGRGRTFKGIHFPTCFWAYNTALGKMADMLKEME